MNVLTFLDDAAALEEILSAIYGILADMTADEEMKKDLRKLQREETNHALVIRTGKNYVRRASEAFGPTIIGETELEGGMEAARSILDNIRSGELDFRAALAHLRRLEDQFEKIHMATVMAVNDEKLQELFRQLSRDDNDHGLRVDDMLLRLG